MFFPLLPILWNFWSLWGIGLLSIVIWVLNIFLPVFVYWYTETCPFHSSRMDFYKITVKQDVLYYRNVPVFYNENTSRKLSRWDLWVHSKSHCNRIKMLRLIFHWYWWTFCKLSCDWVHWLIVSYKAYSCSAWLSLGSSTPLPKLMAGFHVLWWSLGSDSSGLKQLNFSTVLQPL